MDLRIQQIFEEETKGDNSFKEKTDEFLWQEFNMRACSGKNWLPEYEKKEWQKAKETKAEPINQLLLN